MIKGKPQPYNFFQEMRTNPRGEADSLHQMLKEAEQDIARQKVQDRKPKPKKPANLFKTDDEPDASDVEVQELPTADKTSWKAMVKEIQARTKARRDLIGFSMYNFAIASAEDLDTEKVAMTMGRIRINRLTTIRIQIISENRSATVNIFKKYWNSWDADDDNIYLSMNGSLTYVLSFSK